MLDNQPRRITIQDEEANPAYVPSDVFRSYFEADSGLLYPEKLPPDSKERVPLVLEGTNLELFQASVHLLEPQEFTSIRRAGFGASDSSVLLGVNPYTNIKELIAQKATEELTEEELATAEVTAVQKGNDLEPLIVQKCTQALGMEVLKPTDMYQIVDHPYLKINFDGVSGAPHHYFPVEIKVVTKRGERQYNPFKAFYDNKAGTRPLPENYAQHHNALETKAAQYGIPVYYYTQVQMQMMGLNSNFGMLAALFESNWSMKVFFIHKDQHVWNNLKIQGFRFWEEVLALRAKKGTFS